MEVPREIEAACCDDEDGKCYPNATEYSLHCPMHKRKKI